MSWCLWEQNSCQDTAAREAGQELQSSNYCLRQQQINAQPLRRPKNNSEFEARLGCMAGLSPTKSNNQPLCTVKLRCKDNRPYVIVLEGVFIFHLKSNFFFTCLCCRRLSCCGSSNNSKYNKHLKAQVHKPDCKCTFQRHMVILERNLAVAHIFHRCWYLHTRKQTL